MKKIIALAIVVALSGCATAYQPQGLSGGFSSTQLDNNVFAITFKGNAFTSRETANDFALLRSAEISLENGCKYFVILDGQQYSQTGSFTTPTYVTTNTFSTSQGSLYDYGNYGEFNANTFGTTSSTVTGGDTIKTSKPRVSKTIACFLQKPDGFSYNARFIVDSLREKYQLPDHM
ncbi:hypothetical protein HJ078_22605 [Vibrio parahaemolyticus]|uniref:CC0125/CC1285 family lipoprotein n=1 Tax=Vibrio harveyi TaxID=669 RepID=UPI00186A3ED2|nr:hypothetical protein [Vibrio parahaemolyticus]MBE4240919.1 hypothetical protein [Vibrio parahaemolyticus]HCH6427239.1 hypothetical protein [Vibrio parahaemolyticus]